MKPPNTHIIKKAREMKKIKKTATLLSVLFLLPLIGNPGLLLNLRILFLFLAGSVMFLSQPEMSNKDGMRDKHTDGFTLYLILAAGLVSQVSCIVEWAYFRDSTVVRNGIVVGTGVAMVIAGMAFRVWAIMINRWFTATVRVQKGQQVIQNGPYRVVRHPSYLGSLVAVTGSTLVLEAYASSLIALICMGTAYYFRIQYEEQTLIEGLGGMYADFCRSRKFRIIPFIW
jgi:protein-S-isoprenylcysteine O-methyltransferase Ste14